MSRGLDRFGIQPYVRNGGNLELQLRCLVHFIRAVVAELKSKTGLHWKKRLRAWKSGFSSRSWIVYKLDENDPDLYLPDLFAHLKNYRVNGFYTPVIGDKLLLSRLLALHQFPHPDVVSIILGGQLIEENAPFDPDMEQTLSRTLERYPRQVFRPTWSGSGEGVFFLDRDENGLSVNGEKATLAEVCTLLSRLDRYLATEFKEQAAYASKIFPGSANTLRIQTLWDDEVGAPFIAAVVHRFGTARSGRTDHWHRGNGGFCSAVDPETATLGQRVSLSSGMHLVWGASHPDSGEAIEGVVVPGLDHCLAGILRAAGHFPFCPCIGWDVLLTDEGYCILEANTLPGMTIVQVHAPLLKDPRVREFYRRRGMA